MAKKYSNKKNSHSRSHSGSKTKKKSNRDNKTKKKSNRDSELDVDEVNNFDEYENTEQEQYESENNEEEEENEELIENEEDENRPKIKLNNKIRERLKGKIIEWLDCDDKIKILNARAKKYKETKKEREEIIIKMISKLGIEEKKIEVHDNDDNLRGRVYRYKSVTKGSLKEDIIKTALMEAIRDEKKVDQLIKKIESKRPINERYYLKRTKGNKNE